MTLILEYDLEMSSWAITPNI